MAVGGAFSLQCHGVGGNLQAVREVCVPHIMLEKVVVGVDVDLVKDVVTQYTCDCKVVNLFSGSYTAILAYDLKILRTSFSTKNEEGSRFTFLLLKMWLFILWLLSTERKQKYISPVLFFLEWQFQPYQHAYHIHHQGRLDGLCLREQAGILLPVRLHCGCSCISQLLPDDDVV